MGWVSCACDPMGWMPARMRAKPPSSSSPPSAFAVPKGRARGTGRTMWRFRTPSGPRRRRAPNVAPGRDQDARFFPATTLEVSFRPSFYIPEYSARGLACLDPARCCTMRVSESIEQAVEADSRDVMLVDALMIKSLSGLCAASRVSLQHVFILGYCSPPTIIIDHSCHIYRAPQT